MSVNQMGWAFQFATTGAFSLEANKIFDTYAAALDFAKTGKTAYVGSVISVIADETAENNGVYYIESLGENGSLKKAGKDIKTADDSDIDSIFVVE